MFPRKSTFYTLSVLLPCFLIAFNIASSSQTPASVISVHDGDTIHVNHNGKKVTVRLACIDAPEKGQRGRKASVEELNQLLAPGDPVKLRLITQDRYGREIAEVYHDDILVNLQMVREGQAAIYEEYIEPCDATRYRAAQQQAQRSRLGIWTFRDPIMPWDYRQGKRPPLPTSATTQNLPSCIDDDCDCSHFSTQAAAQQVLNAFTGDPHRLDGDEDGVACESLP